MSASKLNWEAIKAEYIAGEDSVTHQALADKHGVNRVTVTRNAKGWDAARLQYRNQVATKTLNRTSTTEAELRAAHIRTGRRMRELGEAAYGNLVRKEKDGTTTLLLSDPSEIRQFIATGADIERKAAGMADKLDVNIDLSKLTDEELAAIAKGGG